MSKSDITYLRCLTLCINYKLRTEAVKKTETFAGMLWHFSPKNKMAAAFERLVENALFSLPEGGKTQESI